MSLARNKRRSLVMKIISDTPVSSQQQLLKLLAGHGVHTTQATISRDIRDLGLVKVAIKPNSYRYLPPRDRTVASRGSLLGEVVHSIKVAGNLMVVQTRPGFAQSVAAAIDSLGWNELLGTVGGDDTVLAVARNPQCALDVCKRLAGFFSVELE